jgi:flagellar M-ring protein FliF
LPDFWKGMGALRVGAMAGVAAALTGFFLYIFGMIAEPPMAILYSGLEPREAGAVAAKLDAINVPYEQRGDGGTILIPADQVSRIRMQLATEGLPSAGVGYEIFDKTDTFGTSTLVQNVNRLRALEGELARTIRSIESIESARVHLVIPERQVFAQANQSPSASVVLQTRMRLGNGQVSAVQHLVAASVAGLSPADVAVIDERGELLAGRNGDTENSIALAQEDRTSAFEERMRQRVENIVASIVGPGAARVQVAAEMDFNRITETSESFDPDSRVIRSSQTVEQNSSEQGARTTAAVSVATALPGNAQPVATDTGPNSSSARNEETINYEISKSTKTLVQDAGTVKKLSVAVVVDGTYTTDANGGRTYAPRSEADMANITALVRSAVGFNEARGDQVQVTNMRFAEPEIFAGEEGTSEPLLGIDSAIWLKLAEILILSVTALLVFILVVRPLIRRLMTPVSASSGSPQAPAIQASPAVSAIAQQAGVQPSATLQVAQASSSPVPLPKRETMIDVSQIEGQVRESAVRKIGDVVQAHPEEAMAIVRTWLHQPV